MRSALEVINEVHEAGKSHPDIYSSAVDDRVLVAAMLELEGRINRIQQSKQDKRSAEDQAITAGELTRGNLQKKMYRLLTAAGNNEQEVALKIHQFLSSLE